MAHIVLRDLRPNPMRDFTVDPMDDQKIAELTKSIKEDGFWGGVVTAEGDDGPIIVAGHTRVAAAIKAGLKSADLFVAASMDPASLVRIYARENATQRGNSGTAMAGSIASAIRYIAKVLLSGNLSGFPERSKRSTEVARGQIATERGLGEPIITEFLDGVPGINKNTVTQQLAILKDSGDYARIIGEIKDEIERELQDQIKAAQKAEAAAIEAEAAAKKAEEEEKAAIARAKAAKEDAARK